MKGPTVRDWVIRQSPSWRAAAPSWTVITVLGLLPYIGISQFTTTLLTEAMIFAIWAMSLDLLVGYAGLVSFGHAAAFGLAGYAAGYFAREVTSDFLVVLVVAQVVVATTAAAIGFIVTRVSGIAFAVISLCVAQVLFTIAVVWREVTNGMDGMVGVPLPKLAGIIIGPGNALYLLTALCLVAVYFGLVRLVDSPFGRTLHAIRTNEERAASIGINVHVHKWIAFVLSWMVAALAGTLMVFLKAGTTPMSLHWSESGNVLIMVIFGGMGTLLGPIIGSAVFVFVRDEFTTRFQAWQFVFGLVFVVVVLAFPRGLVGVFNHIRMSLWRAHS